MFSWRLNEDTVSSGDRSEWSLERYTAKLRRPVDVRVTPEYVCDDSLENDRELHLIGTRTAIYLKAPTSYDQCAAPAEIA